VLQYFYYNLNKRLFVKSYNKYRKIEADSFSQLAHVNPLI